jgi:hypothetical protein
MRAIRWMHRLPAKLPQRCQLHQGLRQLADSCAAYVKPCQPTQQASTAWRADTETDGLAVWEVSDIVLLAPAANTQHARCHSNVNVPHHAPVHSEPRPWQSGIAAPSTTRKLSNNSNACPSQAALTWSECTAPLAARAAPHAPPAAASAATAAATPQRGSRRGRPLQHHG